MNPLKAFYEFAENELQVMAYMAYPVRKLDEILNLSLDVMCRIFHPSACSIMLFNEEGKLQVRAGKGMKKEEEALIELQLGEGIAGWAAKEREITIVKNVHKDPRFVPGSLFPEIVSLVCVPLEVHGRCLGVINMSSSFHRKFTSATVNLLRLLGTRIALAIENHELFTKLEEKEKELESVFQSIPDGIFSVDAQGKIMDLNKAAEHIVGFSAEKALGKIFHDVCPLPHSPRFPLRKDIWKKRRLFQGSTHLKNSKGEKIPVNAYWASLLDHKDNVSGAVCVIRDLRPMQEVENLKRDFISSVSHDLRTPLTSLKGYVRLLRTKRLGNLNASQEECLEALERNTIRLHHMVEELLTFSRVEKQAEAVNLSRMSFKKLVMQLQKDFQPDFEQKGVSFSSNGIPSESIYADKEKLRHVLDNLVGNAVKFTPSGGAVSLSAWIQENVLHFQVQDTGPGIHPKELPHIFNAFYQPHKGKKHAVKEGFGLGLAIVKKLVELQGGQIWAHSVFGEGTTFHFTLPLVSRIANRE